MDNFTYYHIPPVRHLRLKLIEFLHSFGLNVVCHVNVWLHCFVIAMPSPLHDYLGRNTQRQRITNAHPATQIMIDTYMAALGFEKTTQEGRFSNGAYEVWDLVPRNVLVDEDGDIFVVDAEIKHIKPIS